MASIVNIASPVAGNPMLSIQQIAGNMQNMRNTAQKIQQAREMFPLQKSQLEAQTDLINQKNALAAAQLPSAATMAQAQAAIKNYQATHPSTLYSGAAQQAYAGQEAQQQGNQDIANLINTALQSRNVSNQATADWRQQQAKQAWLRTIPAGARTPVVDMLMRKGYFSKDMGDLNEGEREDLGALMSASSRFSQLPATLKTGSVISQAFNSNLDNLNNMYDEVQNVGLKSGIPGWTQMKIADLQSRVSQQPGDQADKIKTLVTQIGDLQETVAKQYMRLMGMPNTDQSLQQAEKIVGSPKNIGQMTWPQLKSKLYNLKLMAYQEEKALQNPLAANLGSKANLPVPSSLSVIPPSREPNQITVKSPNGSVHVIPRDQLQGALQMGFNVVQ